MYKDFNAVNSAATEIDAIKNSIKNIILTARGSLPGKPRFGSDIFKIIFAPLDPLTTTLAENYIREALREFEDRIFIKNVSIKAVPEYNKIVIDIYFSYKDAVFNEPSTASTSIAINL